MSDDPDLQPEQGSGDTRVYPPPARGGLETATGQTRDYRDDLQSRRWNAAPLKNPEVQKTDPRIAVAGIILLSAITLVMIVVGYGSGFWS